MKTLLLIFTLLFSTVVFSSPSYAEWTKIGENVDGTTFYVDFERIRKHDGYVYFWSLNDYLKPFRGVLSDKAYYQVDCKLLRYKALSGSFHKEPMGRGIGDTPPIPKSHKDWSYPSPNSAIEFILKSVCSRWWIGLKTIVKETYSPIFLKLKSVTGYRETLAPLWYTVWSTLQSSHLEKRWNSVV